MKYVLRSQIKEGFLWEGSKSLKTMPEKLKSLAVGTSLDGSVLLLQGYQSLLYVHPGYVILYDESRSMPEMYFSKTILERFSEIEVVNQ